MTFIYDGTSNVETYCSPPESGGVHYRGGGVVHRVLLRTSVEIISDPLVQLCYLATTRLPRSSPRKVLTNETSRHVVGMRGTGLHRNMGRFQCCCNPANHSFIFLSFKPLAMNGQELQGRGCGSFLIWCADLRNLNILLVALVATLSQWFLHSVIYSSSRRWKGTIPPHPTLYLVAGD